MTGIVLGLLFGTGLFCIWWSFWVREEDPNRRSEPPKLIRVLKDDLVQAGYATITPRMLLVGCSAAFLLVFLLVYAVVGVPAIGFCFGLMAAWGPYALVRMRARQRRNRLRDLWPDAVDNITSAVRAGMSLPEAVAQLGFRGPEELRPAFQAFAQDYRITGRFHECLDRLKERLSDPVADRLIESLRIAREVGGSDLGRLLRTLSVFLREDSRTRSELETRQSWTVNAARLAVAAPWIVLAMLSSRPESVQAYSTGTGALILLFGAVMTGVAYWLMVRIGRLPEDERVLR
ncbi:type II secretion system F family protein [Knoellia sp. S7-12]|uniref:type II secretion system F family protein n=1 Tax=Knoellia sp. S7-12 TaxID=3126698 RepID=UPI00336757A6